MQISKLHRRRLAVAMTNVGAAEAICDALETAVNRQAAVVTAIAATTNLPTDTVGNLAAGAETRLDGLETKVNAILTSLKNAKIMASS